MKKLLLYCLKSKPWLNECFNRFFLVTKKNENIPYLNLNGKIVAQCECDLVEEIFNEIVYWEDFIGHQHDVSTKTLCGLEIFNKSCLKEDELISYLGEKNGYALHLKNVKVLTSDEQNRFGSFGCLSSKNEDFKPITHAPRNMMKVYYGDGEVLNQEEYILLSIHPEPLSKIMNGEKTIEVRRKILKDLKELIK